MTRSELAKKDTILMGLLKVDEIRHEIAETNKGRLSLMLRKGQGHTEYRFVLDAVPFDQDTSNKIMQLFEGLLFEEKRDPVSAVVEAPEIKEDVNTTTEEPSEGDRKELPEEEASE